MFKDAAKKFRELCTIGLALFLLFIVHRSTSFEWLNRRSEWSLIDQLDHFFVGALSDFWIACLFSLGVALLWPIRRTSIRLALQTILYGVVAALVILHQWYVEFFRMQILPFHMRYILDANFVTGNGLPDLSPQVLIVTTAAVMFIILHIIDARTSRVSWRWPLIYVASLLLGLCAHTLNIRWRVNHFIQDHLQVNLFERLAIAKSGPTDIPQPSSDIAQQVSTALHRPLGPDLKNASAALVLHESSADPFDANGTAIASLVEERRRAGRKTIIVTLLLESMRPSETSLFAPSASDTRDLTPNVRALGEQGYWFSNAYSVGTVTRSGQEAVSCGYGSSMFNSLMREQTGLAWDCLPQLLRDKAHTFWFHGGDPNFDNQLSFWQRQSVAQTLDIRNFDRSIATGWGAGDLSLLQRSAQELAHFHKAETGMPMAVGMVLSISNHIPWALPKDHNMNPQEISTDGQRHPSHLLTAYVDRAIGDFVTALKQKGLWQDTVLILASDHGSRVTPYYDLYAADSAELKQAKLMTHIVLVVSGGITETARMAQGVAAQTQFVSQADVAPFVAKLSGVDLKSVAYPLFGRNEVASSDTVVSVTEEGVYLPSEATFLRNSDLKSKLSQHPLSNAQGFLVFYLDFHFHPQ